MEDIYEFLQAHDISFNKVEHPAVYTCEEAKELVPPIQGTHTKNLFLRDKKGKRHWLVVVGYDKAVDLKALGESLDAKHLSLASAERLQKYLGVEPGSATVLGLLTDTDHEVEVIFDTEIWEAAEILCHPLVNTATLSIPHAGIETFLGITKHTPTVMEVPGQ